MKQIKQLFVCLTALLLLAACGEGDLNKNFPVAPHTTAYAGLKGHVKESFLSYYGNKKFVGMAVHDYYDVQGRLTTHVVYLNGDSTVYFYHWENKRYPSNVTVSNGATYTQKIEKKRLAEECFTNGSSGTRFNYTYETAEYGGRWIYERATDIASGDTMCTVYSIDSTRAEERVVYANDGSRKVTECNDMENGDLPTDLTYYNSKDEKLNSFPITVARDDQGNITEFNASKKGKRKEYYTCTYQYYTDAELASAGVSESDATTFDDVISSDEAPSETLLWVILGLSLLALCFYLAVFNEGFGLFKNFGGEEDEDGMKKMWMYNSAPYTKMGLIFLSIALAFITAILLLLLFGVAVWGLFWVVYGFLWAIIIIGWICLVVGALACLGQQWYCLPIAIIGGVIVWKQDTLSGWADMFRDWGETTLAEMNAIDWAITIFQVYGPTAGYILGGLIALFLAIALVFIIICLFFRAVEYLVLKAYSVKNPCPVCGNTESFHYILEGEENQRPLHPGVYGIFHQTNYNSGVRMPTMIWNGKAELTRRCDNPNCGAITNKGNDFAMGTDKHIGIVGERSSGKSYMLYSALEIIKDSFGDQAEQVDTDKNNKIEDVVKRIHEGEGIQTQRADHYRAIQMTVKRKFAGAPPHHLFFYDVAGEMFNSQATDAHSALTFYQNVKTIVFVIDPSMLDLERAHPSDEFVEWLEKNGGSEKFDPLDTLSRLSLILHDHGRNAKDINIFVVLTKKDMGYFDVAHLSSTPSEDELKAFIRKTLGLMTFLTNVENTYKRVHYAAVSTNAGDTDTLKALFQKVLKQNGVDMD